MIKVFRGGSLIDGTGREPIEDAVIVVERSRISPTLGSNKTRTLLR